MLLWHGWLLEGSGSNVYTAKVAEAYRGAGHSVLILCQEPHPERFPFIDEWGTVDADRVSLATEDRSGRSDGHATLLRPDIGSLLPVFVVDKYEGFPRVARFVDLSDAELNTYIDANTEAFRTAAKWFRPDAVIAGHAIPGSVVASRALGSRQFVAKIHGSDLEYAVRLQSRYLDLAREGLEAARSVIAPSGDALARTGQLIPSVIAGARVVQPGVEVDRFRPLPRPDTLDSVAQALEDDPDVSRGRPEAGDEMVRRALQRRDAHELDRLAGAYDQAVPDPGAAGRLRALAPYSEPLIGYLGKLIPQKGVHLFIQALALLPGRMRGLVVGFGSFREWLQALVLTVNDGSRPQIDWMRQVFPGDLELTDGQIERAHGLAGRLTFTGRLDHRYAPGALAALDVLVVPSILEEAFGMVASEGAAAGALPLVARHSGLAEVGAALEQAVGQPGLFTFQPGPGSVERIASGVQRLVAIPGMERRRLGRAVSEFVAREWTWERTAEKLLDAARS